MAIKIAKKAFCSGTFSGTILLLLAAVFTLCGCQSDRYYQARAAERAREFLIKNAPELNPDQVAYVKFNDPVLLTGEGLEGRERGIQQICVAWDIPGCQSLYMVFGASRARMDDWYPNRVIRKNFVSPGTAIDRAVEMCRQYAVTNFYEVLSKSDLNKIRLSNPEIVETGFEPRPDNEGIVPKTTQISLLWNISEHRYAVFCGYSPKADLVNWQINFAAVMPDFEANFVRGRVLKTPADYNTPIYLPENDKIGLPVKENPEQQKKAAPAEKKRK